MTTNNFTEAARAEAEEYGKENAPTLGTMALTARAHLHGAEWARTHLAALTDPPARPEGAYELETVIGLNAGKWTNGAEDVRALADLLASNGVRATGGE